MICGAFIIKRRLALGISQREVSEALGFSSSQFVSNWERGDAGVPMKHVFKLAEVLDCSPASLKKRIVLDAVADLNNEYEKAFWIYGTKKNIR